MKESTLLEMKKKIESLTNVVQFLMNEVNHLRELGIGSLETIKLMPGYEDAINELKKQMEENVEQKQKAKQNGTIKSETK